MISKFRTEYQSLEKLWQQGIGGGEPLREYSMLVDRFLVSCFHKIDVENKETSVALVALGGYGRQELFPRSDIDLMILFRSEYKEVGQLIDVFYVLDDRGKKLTDTESQQEITQGMLHSVGCSVG